jgi:hypothetical protein
MFDWQPLRTADIVLAVAALLGPILAVQAQKWVEQWREKRDRRVGIFRTLMATRVTRLAPQHVEALNAIPIDFYGDQTVMDLWDEYFSHLCKEPNSEAQSAIWHADSQRYFVALITAIARKIGYKFNAAEMERAYFPKGHVNMQNDQQITQHCLARWLSGDLSVKMEVTSIPGPDEEAVAKQEELRAAAVDWLKMSVPSNAEPDIAAKLRKSSAK